MELVFVKVKKKMPFGNITEGFINSVLQEFRKEDNQERLRCYVLNPVAKYIENYLKPYFFTLLIVLLLMVGLLLWILRLLLRFSPQDLSA